MRPVLLAALVLVAGLAGCNGNRPTTIEPPSLCIGVVCKADPQSHDARYVQATYGLTQITNDSYQETLDGVDGDLVVWHVYRGNERDGYYNPLYAYNLTSGKLFGVVTDVDQGIMVPRLSEGRVVFHQENRDGTTALKLWDSRTNVTRTLSVGLGGQQFPDSFQGQWLIFANEGSSNNTENAWWAWNLETHQLVYLYTPLYRNQLPDGSYRTLTFTAIDNGVAYYPLTYSDSKSRFFNATLFAVNLTTQETRQWNLSGDSLFRLSVSDGFAASDPGGRIAVLNITNGTFYYAQQPDDKFCGFPSTKHGWLTYSCSMTVGHSEYYAILVNLQTGQRFRYDYPNLPIETTATDGNTLIIAAGRGPQLPSTPKEVYEVYDSYHSDLYWMKVPS